MAVDLSTQGHDRSHERLQTVENGQEEIWVLWQAGAYLDASSTDGFSQSDIILIKNSCIMLQKKDQFFNWWGPSKTTRYRLPNVLRVYVEGKRKSITLSAGLCRELELDTTKPVRAAIVLDDETPFVTFNPKEGVPFINLEIRGNSKSPSYNSKELAQAFGKRFELDRRCRYYDFHVKYWQRMSGMELYKLELVDRNCE